MFQDKCHSKKSAIAGKFGRKGVIGKKLQIRSKIDDNRETRIKIEVHQKKNCWVGSGQKQ
jgi:hypothetical protein